MRLMLKINMTASVQKEKVTFFATSFDYSDVLMISSSPVYFSSHSKSYKYTTIRNMPNKDI